MKRIRMFSIGWESIAFFPGWKKIKQWHISFVLCYLRMILWKISIEIYLYVFFQLKFRSYIGKHFFNKIKACVPVTDATECAGFSTHSGKRELIPDVFVRIVLLNHQFSITCFVNHWLSFCLFSFVFFCISFFDLWFLVTSLSNLIKIRSLNGSGYVARSNIAKLGTIKDIISIRLIY